MLSLQLNYQNNINHIKNISALRGESKSVGLITQGLQLFTSTEIQSYSRPSRWKRRRNAANSVLQCIKHSWAIITAKWECLKKWLHRRSSPIYLLGSINLSTVSSLLLMGNSWNIINPHHNLFLKVLSAAWTALLFLSMWGPGGKAPLPVPSFSQKNQEV